MYVRKLLIRQERHLKARGSLAISPGPSPTIYTFETGWHEVCHPPGHKTIERNTGLLGHYQPKFCEKKKLVLGRTILKKGKFQSKCIGSLT